MSWLLNWDLEAMNRAIEARIRKLEKEANMGALQRLTDEELEARILAEFRTLAAEHGSVMDAVRYYRGLGIPELSQHADALEAFIPQLQEIIGREQGKRLADLLP
ncbi:hypothetical protein [Methylobacterium sp. ID0610]|uniref:hypothetical protein n=1 Tax=Methylobacterium carpenticola TaxID=3344827 RepID=UPI00368D1EA9